MAFGIFPNQFTSSSHRIHLYFLGNKVRCYVRFFFVFCSPPHTLPPPSVACVCVHQEAKASNKYTALDHIFRGRKEGGFMIGGTFQIIAQTASPIGCPGRFFAAPGHIQYPSDLPFAGFSCNTNVGPIQFCFLRVILLTDRTVSLLYTLFASTLSRSIRRI